MSRKNANGNPLTSRTGALTACAAALGLALLAAPASAGGEFGRGFENEMGRIFAHAVFGTGVGLLHAAGPPPVVVHHAPRPVVVYHAPPPVVVHKVHYRDHGRHYGHRGHGHKHHVRHHPGHRHSGGPPWKRSGHSRYSRH